MGCFFQAKKKIETNYRKDLALGKINMVKKQRKPV